jgi:hypothetical protein
VRSPAAARLLSVRSMAICFGEAGTSGGAPALAGRRLPPDDPEPSPGPGIQAARAAPAAVEPPVVRLALLPWLLLLAGVSLSCNAFASASAGGC